MTNKPRFDVQKVKYLSMQQMCLIKAESGKICKVNCHLVNSPLKKSPLSFLTYALLTNKILNDFINLLLQKLSKSFKTSEISVMRTYYAYP